MPVYEYRCKDCDTTFDKLVRSSDDSSVTCKSCSSENVRRMVSSFAMVGGYDDTFTASSGGGCCGGSCGCGH